MFTRKKIVLNQNWGAFLACFAICAFVSAYIMAWKTDRENKEKEEALKRLKDEKKEE